MSAGGFVRGCAIRRGYRKGGFVRWCAACRGCRRGMPSRKCARPAPDPAAGHPWPALGIPLLHPRQARTILSVGRKKRWDGSAARCGNAITLHRRPDRIDCSETPQVLGWYLDFAACDLRLVAPRRPNFAPPRHRDPCKLAAPSGLAFHPEAHARRSPSCAQGVCAQPAMDGRRPALGARTRREPGEHTPCAQDGPRELPARPPFRPHAGCAKRASLRLEKIGTAPKKQRK